MATLVSYFIWDGFSDQKVIIGYCKNSPQEVLKHLYKSCMIYKYKNLYHPLDNDKLPMGIIIEDIENLPVGLKIDLDITDLNMDRFKFKEDKQKEPMIKILIDKLKYWRRHCVYESVSEQISLMEEVMEIIKGDCKDMKYKIDLSKLNINKIGQYDHTEFYPKNHILANGEFKTKDNTGKVVTVSISIMKINNTEFTNLCGFNVYGDDDCRNKYKTDKEMTDDYYEDLNPEYALVTLVYDADCLNYKSISFTTESITSLSCINNPLQDEEFQEALQYELKENLFK